ncbi:LuxR C-terminal-related transcriptional regulator [Chryseobacterium sp. RG1]|uniref:LuxR C-terminal-related transcriptional regulator n=1 Tax=Chryseobacterium tagetis TaxID=2801334 RepID=A0ABS8A5C6_9FLAO|nr:LuxR C-terminal-related transcriptional regulator [Chryseobacterium tagetis]MCA6069191.1 LuxR C-terminal-related transcriptional regulator [Chryseobacterium tagetis]
MKKIIGVLLWLGCFSLGWAQQSSVGDLQHLTKNGSVALQQQTKKAFHVQQTLDFNEKEQRMMVLQEKADSQRKQKSLLIALIGVGTLGALVLFRFYHLSLRYSLAREKQLIAEKKEAALQIKYEQEEQARLRAEQALMILQQQKLTDEVMANQLQLQHKNNVLLQLQEKLSQQEMINIYKILRDESRMDNEFEKSKYQIQEMHPDFFRNLNKNAVQRLTSLDQKYCAYLYLGMDTKQIASILNVEAKSVRMTKYRLKQKFGLDSETDLINYLKSIK